MPIIKEIGNNKLQKKFIESDKILTDVAIYDGRRKYLKTGFISPLANITDNGDGTITCPQNKVRLMPLLDGTQPILEYIVSEKTLTIPANGLSYVYAGFNSGNVEYFITTDKSVINGIDTALFTTIYKSGSSVNIFYEPTVELFTEEIYKRLFKKNEILHISGLEISETGTQNIQVKIGTVFYKNKEIFLSDLDTSTGNYLVSFYHSSGALVKDESTQTYNNTQYDNGTDLVILSDETYGFHWLLRDINTDKIILLYGTGEYSSIKEALLEKTITIPDEYKETAFLLGKIVFPKGGEGIFFDYNNDEIVDFIDKMKIDENSSNADTLDGLDSTQFLRSDEDDIMTGLLDIRRGTATEEIEYLRLNPTDWASGKPYLSFKKDATENVWQIILWDGNANSGIINFKLTKLQVNDVDVSLATHNHNLSGLADVNVSGLADGNVLIWDETNSIWKPGTVSGGGGTASDITVDTTNFDGILTSSEDNVQKALDKIDDVALNKTGDTISGTINIGANIGFRFNNGNGAILTNSTTNTTGIKFYAGSNALEFLLNSSSYCEIKSSLGLIQLNSTNLQINDYYGGNFYGFKYSSNKLKNDLLQIATGEILLGSTKRGGSDNLLELSGSTSSTFISVQDGTGRFQIKWNATYGTSETFLVGGENAGRIIHNPNDTTAIFKIDYADGSSANAGDSITWTEILKVGISNLFYKDFKIWHEGNDGTGSGLDADKTDGKHINVLSQADYDALSAKDGNTLYFTYE